MRTAGLATVINGILTDANTEYKIVLPLNYKKLLLQARESVLVKFSFIEGNSGTQYITLKAGSSYSDDHIRTNRHLFVQSPTAGSIVEVLVWNGGDDYL